MILVNFKNYESAVGENAVALAKIHEVVATETGAPIAVAVSALDLEKVAAAVKIPVWSQHLDAAEFGSSTGAVVPELLKKMGAVGTILNHSEKRVVASLAERVAAAKRAGLKIIICAENDDEAAKFAAEFEPDFVAVEPPELIGGDISVTAANPEIVKNSVAKVGATPLLVGAGVKNGEDVRTAAKLGAAGVLLASGVTKSDNPAEVLRELAAGFLN